MSAMESLQARRDVVAARFSRRNLLKIAVELAVVMAAALVVVRSFAQQNVDALMKAKDSWPADALMKAKAKETQLKKQVGQISSLMTQQLAGPHVQSSDTKVRKALGTRDEGGSRTLKKWLDENIGSTSGNMISSMRESAAGVDQLVRAEEFLLTEQERASSAREQHTKMAVELHHKLKVRKAALEADDEENGERAKNGWGLFNKENGVIRVDCGDTVADGGGGTSKALKDRFWGPVGTRYLVECPPGCGKFDATIYGCGTFLDGSAICKTGMMEGKVGYDSGGYVEVELVDPIPKYEGCSANAISEVPVPEHRAVNRQTFTSMPYEWYGWKRAEKPDQIAKLGEEGALLKYRTSCKDEEDTECFGRRAFRLATADMEFVPPPKISPSSGEYPGKVEVSMSAPTCVQQILYSLDGSEPTSSASDGTRLYESPFFISHEGVSTIKAISYSEMRPPYTSDVVSAVYTIVPTAQAPLIFPEGAEGEAVQLIIGEDNITMVPQEAGDTIHYTTDGNDPSASSDVYSSHIPVTPTLVSHGSVVTVKAIAISADVSKMPSTISVRIYSAVEACPAPLLSPASGAELIPLQGDRVLISCSEECEAFFSQDGSPPTNASHKVLGPLILDPGARKLKVACIGEGFVPSATVAATYDVLLPKAAAPTFDPQGAAGEDDIANATIIGYMQPLPVELVCNESNASAFYVMTSGDDDTMPAVTQHSPAYRGAIQVRPPIGHASGVTRIHAICCGSSLRPSDVAEAQYAVIERAPSPTFTPASGTLFPWKSVLGKTGEPVHILISDILPEVVLRYSINAGEWQQCGLEVNGPPGSQVARCPVELRFSCDGTEDKEVNADGYTTCTFVFRAVASREGMVDSEVEYAEYVIRVPPPLSAPEFAPNPEEQQVVDASADAVMDASILCESGEAHFAHNDDLHDLTRLSPTWRPGALQLPIGRHVVSALCYSSARMQISAPVTVTYDVVPRAPMPIAKPPSGTALKAGSGTVPVVLTVPLAEASVVFTINGGRATFCGSHEDCHLDLPVECPQEYAVSPDDEIPVATTADSSDDNLADNVSVATVSPADTDNNLVDAWSDDEDLPVDSPTVPVPSDGIDQSVNASIVAGQEEGGGERMQVGAEDASTAGVRRRRLLSEAANGTASASGDLIDKDDGQTGAFVCHYTIVAVAQARAAGFVDSRAATFVYTVADTDPMMEFAQRVIQTRSSASTPRGLNVDINSIRMSGYQPVVFTRLPPPSITASHTVYGPQDPAQITASHTVYGPEPPAVITSEPTQITPDPFPVIRSAPAYVKSEPAHVAPEPPPIIHSEPAHVSPEPPPVISKPPPVVFGSWKTKITPPLPVQVNEEPPDYGPHEYGGTYKETDADEAELGLGTIQGHKVMSLKVQRALMDALSRQAQVDTQKAFESKQHLMRTGVRIHAELTEMQGLDANGDRDRHAEMVKVLEQERRQMADLRRERLEVRARNKVVSKYQMMLSALSSDP